MGRRVLLVLMLVAVTSCGNNRREPELLTPLTTPMNDPVLTKAADVIQPLLEKEFTSTYAGLEIRGDVPMIVIYRRPDPRLEEAVHNAAPYAHIEFHDARYTRAEMAEHVTRVMDDTEYWKARGVGIVQAGPAVDGSGVRVGAMNPPDDLARQLEERYPAMSFEVEESGEIVPAPYTGPIPVYPAT
ncbi:MAG: hypothetical protein QOF58_1772 [Pseudonocardiales bacterium]|nr:hypothetical protein [Pseudonocardiales bacterium]